MVKVDSKGRIVLPQTVRDRLGIEPGAEVVVREEGGKAVVEPEDDPERIIDRLESLVERTAPARGERSSRPDEIDPIARKHREAIRRGAQQNTNE